MTSAVGSSTNSINPSATSSSGIDVGSIVSQLMIQEKKPLVALQNKVTQSGVIVSDLGILKSKMAAFQTALTTLESPATYQNTTATSSNASVATVNTSSGATLGRYSIEVAQTAESSNFAISGFTSLTQTVALGASGSGFNLTVGTPKTTTVNSSSLSGSTITVASTDGIAIGMTVIGTGIGANATVSSISGNIVTLSVNNSSSTAVSGNINFSPITYNSSTSYNSTTQPATTGGTRSAINSSTSTLEDLNNWINSLYNNFSLNISSSIIKTTSGNYSLSISGTQTGISNAVSFSGLNGTSVNTTADTTSTTSSSSTNSSPYSVLINSQARDSKVTINGLTVQRSSNSISDVVKNTTINLINQVLPTDIIKPSTLVNITQGTSNLSTTMQNFITAYNAMITQYKSMTANSVNTPGTTQAGSLASAPGILSFVGNIKESLSGGALTATKANISLKSLGMDLQIDGTLKFNQANLTSSESLGLLSTLSAGLSVGGNINNSNNLYTFVAGVVNPGGTIDSTVTLQSQNTTYLNSRVKALASQLVTKENSYYAQYSKLNSLLFTLNQTSSQLTSSLAAVTNINKG